MKIKIKYFAMGLLIGCILMVTTPVLADSITQKIDVVFNSVQVQVNGENVNVDNILYNGSAYLPVRKVAEVVGKDIEWNQETMTANIVEKTDIKEGDDVEGISTTAMTDLTYEELMNMFDKGFVLDESKFHARHYVYNGDLPFEEIRSLIHSQSEEFLESFSNRAISEHYDNELYEAGDGLVITLGYSYFEGVSGNNIMLSIEKAKDFNNGETFVRKATGAYKK